MKFVTVFLLFSLVRLAVSTFGPIVHDDCIEKFSDDLKMFIKSRNRQSQPLARILVIDRTESLDVDRILRRLSVGDDMTITGVIKGSKQLPKRLPVDYVLVLHDFYYRKIVIELMEMIKRSLLKSTRIVVANFYGSSGERSFFSPDLSNALKDGLHMNRLTNFLIAHAASDSVSYWRPQPSERHATFSKNSSIGSDFSTVQRRLGQRKAITVAHMENPPYDKIVDDRMAGVAGQMLDEFCRRFNVTYELSAPVEDLRDLTRVIPSMHVTLYTRLMASGVTGVENVWLGEFDGACLLVPRNIPVSAYENLSLPFGREVLLSVAATVTTIGLLWMAFKRAERRRVSLTKIAFMLFGALLGREMNDDDGWSWKEILLIYPFLFMQILFIGLYQSWIIAVMVSRPTLRSVASLEELNGTETRVDRYFHEASERLRPELVVEMVSIGESNLIYRVPEDFRRSLAYLVTCQYAENFVRTSRNLNENSERIFDVLPTPLTSFPMAYLVHENFALKDEFRDFVQTMRESGIFELWTRQATESSASVRQHFERQRTLMDFDDCAVAFMACLYGLVASGAMFAIEIGCWWMLEILAKFRNKMAAKLGEPRIIVVAPADEEL